MNYMYVLQTYKGMCRHDLKGLNEPLDTGLCWD